MKNYSSYLFYPATRECFFHSNKWSFSSLSWLLEKVLSWENIILLESLLFPIIGLLPKDPYTILCSAILLLYSCSLFLASIYIFGWMRSSSLFTPPLEINGVDWIYLFSAASAWYYPVAPIEISPAFSLSSCTCLKST